MILYIAPQSFQKWWPKLLLDIFLKIITKILLHKGGHIVWQSSTSVVADTFKFMTIFFTVPAHTFFFFHLCVKSYFAWIFAN